MEDGNSTRATDHKGPPYVPGKEHGYDLPPEIFKAELDAIGRRRGRPNTEQIPEPSVDRGLVGLALSGGGIRSATFALGVMQRLAKKKLFEKFDYLSTVSGGGYIGSSITWLTSAKAERESGKTFGLGPQDFPYGTGDPADRPDPGKLSDPQKMLRYLRQHGNYLTPGEGITLLSGVAMLLRGTVLNLLVWLPITVAVMSFVILGSQLLSDVPSVAKLFPPPPESPSIGKEVSCAEAECIKERNAPERAIINGGPTLVFDLAWVLALIPAAVFLIACLIYSLMTFKKRGKGTSRYNKRRWFEGWIRRPLKWLFWLMVFGSLPIVDGWVRDWVAEAGGIGSALIGIATGLFAFVRSGKPGGGGKAVTISAAVGAALLIYGIALLSYQLGLRAMVPVPEVMLPGKEIVMQVLVGPVIVVILLLVAIVTGLCVNLNYISIHRFYRDRLMESFMPDIKNALDNKTGPAKGADPARMHELWGSDTPPGPYHIVNTNVVLVDSKTRTFFIRGGDNFILSPLYCGSQATGWRQTEEFMGGSMTLATAMAISGAAANPNAGVGGVGLTRNPLVSLLMALLNLRLGYWAANPNLEKEKKQRPNHFDSAKYELGLGNLGYQEKLPFIQLSDGGHFENLAVYELIRRRMKVIVVCDGGADKDFSFSDLQITLRRINTDFGARIEFGDRDKPDNDTNKPKRLTPQDDHIAGYPKGVKLADQGYIVGDITYADGTTGTLIFLKTTLIPGLRVELMGYKGANPDFPDQTTADQFFDDEQFEAYRELGYTIAKEMINDIGTNNEYDDNAGLREFIPKTQ